MIFMKLLDLTDEVKKQLMGNMADSLQMLRAGLGLTQSELA
jgi:DNA-binding XRE family transcriptional regulator